MSATPIRVMVVDDHPMIRRGLRAYFLGRDDVVCVGEAADGQEAMERVASLAPDVILLDLQMPRMDGLEAATQLRARAPGARIVVLTSSQSGQVAAQALQVGASAFLLKDTGEEDLIATIRLVHAGHRLIPPGAHAPPADPAPQAPDTPPLSRRELEILTLVVAGNSNKEIAHRLALSVSTVKFHLSSVMAKLGVSSRTEATAVALQRRLVPES